MDMCTKDKKNPLPPPKLREKRGIMAEKEPEDKKFPKGQCIEKTKQGETDR